MSEGERPYLIAQLSDPHIGAPWGGGDPVRGLAAAVAQTQALPQAPDIVIVTGDLADHGAEEEYVVARELLSQLGAPIYALPGNHDDRAALRRVFELPGSDAGPIQYVVELGRLRIAMLDTTRPGEDEGELDAERLRWLDAALARAPRVPTLVAMHHPPVITGVPAWDRLAVPAAGRHGLREILERHRQARWLTSGHLHRALSWSFGPVAAIAVPSTYVQTRLDFTAGSFEFTDAPAAIAVHALLGQELVSHLEPVTVAPAPGGSAR